MTHQTTFAQCSPTQLPKSPSPVANTKGIQGEDRGSATNPTKINRLNFTGPHYNQPHLGSQNADIVASIGINA